MKSIFLAKQIARVRPNDILAETCKSATFGDKSLETLGPKMWNALPQNIKAENSFMLNLRNILQHCLDQNANVTYSVLITVKTKSLSNQLKTFSCFNVNPLLRNVLLLLVVVVVVVVI